MNEEKYSKILDIDFVGRANFLSSKLRIIMNLGPVYLPLQIFIKAAAACKEGMLVLEITLQ